MANHKNLYANFLYGKINNINTYLKNSTIGNKPLVLHLKYKNLNAQVPNLTYKINTLNTDFIDFFSNILSFRTLQILE